MAEPEEIIRNPLPELMPNSVIFDFPIKGKMRKILNKIKHFFGKCECCKCQCNLSEGKTCEWHYYKKYWSEKRDG